MAMSQRLNKMLLKRPRGRPSRLSNSMQSFQPGFGAHDNGRAVAIGGGNEGSMAGGYDGIPPNSSTPLLASDPSASAFEMNWMVNTGTSVDGRNLAETNNSLSFERTATSPSGRYPGEMGLFERMKRGAGQYSSEDDFEEVTNSDNEGVSVMLEKSNAASVSSSVLPPQDEGDSQQAAEAMVQLSGTQYFSQTVEESMEIDPNYDPSDFLGMSGRQLVSESTTIQLEQNESIQFQYQQGAPSAFDPNFPQFQQQQLQYGEQQMQQMVCDEQQMQMQMPPMEQQQQQQSSVLPPLQSLHKDLAISDSDDEQNNLQMDIFNNTNENDDNDDGGELWF